MMSRRTQIFLALISLLTAAGSGLLVYSWFDRMVTVAEVVVPARTIPAGALIRPDMLMLKEVARPLLKENIYIRPDDLTGKVAVVPLQTGMLVYRPFAVPLQEYRLVDDPSMEVVSFPINPARAVGGQIQPGHRINIWELAATRPISQTDLLELASGRWATATLVLESVLVVDVRAASGQAVARSPQAVPGQMEGQSQSSSSGALQILTVAVPRDQAEKILHLAAMENGGAQIWVSLAPAE
jgi:Flp pilus assembly protein CpaB